MSTIHSHRVLSASSNDCLSSRSCRKAWAHYRSTVPHPTRQYYSQQCFHTETSKLTLGSLVMPIIESVAGVVGFALKIMFARDGPAFVNFQIEGPPSSGLVILTPVQLKPCATTSYAHALLKVVAGLAVVCFSYSKSCPLMEIPYT